MSSPPPPPPTTTPSHSKEFYFVDAFTTHSNSPFTGNPAGVCFLESDDDLPDDIKQKMANEVNLSNTAFVSHRWTKHNKKDDNKEDNNSDNNPTFTPEGNVHIIRRTLRWFTPMSEVPLCGHATVATTKSLVHKLFLSNPLLKEKEEILIEFDSRYRGLLGSTFNCKTERIILNFPASCCLPLYADGEKWIQKMIEATIYPELTIDSIQDIQYSPPAKIVLLRLGDHLNETDLKKVSPNYAMLKAVENCDDMFGVLVTVKGKSPPDVEKEVPHFYSRFFAPWVGVNEDPVCGAAHTVLAPYWTKEYFNGFGETLLARQHSERGGNILCTLVDSERVTLAGEARIIFKGEYVVNHNNNQEGEEEEEDQGNVE